jgi:CoA:oxalate CoA-transferase
MRKLLEGVRVLDFSLAAVGPLCARMLCDLGADVTLVEWPRLKWKGANTGMEKSRFRADPDVTREVELFVHCNGGKKSIAVNLKSKEGVDIIKALIAETDVVIENMTPRVMRSFGLNYEALVDINPQLVMCSLTGFGQEGLDGDLARPCVDPVAVAMAGLNWVTGEREGAPYVIGGGIGDTATATLGAVAILAALWSRERHGQGEYIDISMVESLAFLDCTALPALTVTGLQPQVRNGQQSGYRCPMGTFKARDGYISLMAVGSGAESPWGRLCSLMDREDLLEDPRLVDDYRRTQNAPVVVEAIEHWLATLDDRETVLTLLATERITAGPVLSQEEMLSHRFFKQRQTFGQVDYPELGPVSVVEPPYKLRSSEARIRGRAPEMGEHTRDIVGRLPGMDAATIAGLMAAGVLYESPAVTTRLNDPDGTAAGA